MTDYDSILGDFVPDDDFFCEGDLTIALTCVNCGSEIGAMDEKCNNCGIVFDIGIDDDYNL
jgi:hypothetical protein